MGENFDHKVYSAEVVEFVTVAKEFCAFIEQFSEYDVKDFLERSRKFIPLLYLKGVLLPTAESDAYLETEKFVTEQDWNYLREGLRTLLAQYDEYAEDFVDRLHETDDPQAGSISENFADIYSALKDFLIAYREGLLEVMNEALWDLKDSFDLYWGKALVNSLRVIHNLLAGEIDADLDLNNTNSPDMNKSFIGRRQDDLRGE
ncbi:MAG: DUF5063 domain-containing protein [Marinifilaceae bacterium]